MNCYVCNNPIKPPGRVHVECMKLPIPEWDGERRRELVEEQTKMIMEVVAYRNEITDVFKDYKK